MKNILHYGLQRSGTNFLETLLKKNFRIKILNYDKERDQPLQKHFRLYDDKQFMPEPQYDNDLRFENFAGYVAALNTTKKVDGIVVISKDPYSWLLSYRNWAEKCSWPSVEHHYIEEYIRFYSKWRQFAQEDDRIHFVRYIDLLSNPEKELNKIKEKLGLNLRLSRKITGKVKGVGKVSQSKGFTQDKLNYYLNKEYLNKFSKEEMELIQSKVEPDLLDFLGYD